MLTHIEIRNFKRLGMVMFEHTLGKAEAYATPSPLPRGSRFPPFTHAPLSGPGIIPGGSVQSTPFQGGICFDLRRLRIKILHAWKSHSPKVFQAKPPIIGFPFSLVLLQRRRIRIHRSSLLNKDRLFDTAVAKYVSASRLDRSGVGSGTYAGSPGFCFPRVK
uniref:Uncharacterized protein n=1 Tax=Candidatus Kentrum sp. LPFa TaxID=2126335 RepID=A0A450WZ17_9GAMM|nr:MAG: hypothetical protein BECKLPF1236A_GA0070988_103381 [Candidatus Kentron sp. LPFa]